MFGKRDIFRDTGPELSEAERHRNIRTAGTLARQAQQTLTLTARKQYRRYRTDAGGPLRKLGPMAHPLQEGLRGTTALTRRRRPHPHIRRREHPLERTQPPSPRFGPNH